MMKTLSFGIDIYASPEKIWEVMLGKETYPLWTAPFDADSSVETTWEEGSQALFLNKEGNGMVADIGVHEPASFLSIIHKGTYQQGVIDLDSEEVKKWAGARENYRLTRYADHSRMEVSLEVTEEDTDSQAYFLKTMPEALQLLKTHSEAIIPPVVV